MCKDTFNEFLHGRNFSEESIQKYIGIANRFEIFRKQTGLTGISSSHSKDDFLAFSTFMIRENLNAFDNYYGMALYGRFLKNNDVYVSAIELIDGGEAMDNLYEKVGTTLGRQERDEIFKGIQTPPLGTPNSEKPRIMQAALERLEAKEPEICRKILASGLRTLDDEYSLEDRRKYHECKNIDEYLERRGKEFIAELEQIKREGRLFFTQEITDDVIEFVRSHPEIRQGVRVGNILYETKIPHMAKEYLAEQDVVMKRYYYCHCPWVKESLRTNDVSITPTFCNCSAAFHKKPWEVIFGQSLEAEVVNTVLKGDLWCKFAIHLPNTIE